MAADERSDSSILPFENSLESVVARDSLVAVDRLAQYFLPFLKFSHVDFDYFNVTIFLCRKLFFVVRAICVYAVHAHTH
jgi:hypothetical protein